MFDFMDMGGTYENRKVGRDDFDWGFISTAMVTDGGKPYETAVKCSLYSDGLDGATDKMCIVESYDSKEDATKGHKKWIKTMTAKKLPETLTDCANAGVAELMDAMIGEPKVFTLLKTK